MTKLADDVRTSEVQVGDYTVHLNEVGDPADPAVLWLHGSGPGVSALSNWRGLITTMPGLHHIAPDVLGFGESSHPDDAPRGTDAYTPLRAQVCLGLLDALRVGTPHVVGNSMGGLIALRMVQQAPQRVRRLVLMGSAGAPSKPSSALMQMITYYRDPTAPSMRALLEQFMYDPGALGHDLDQIVTARVAAANRPEVERSHKQTFDPQAGPPTPLSPAELGAIGHETLVLHGRDDRVIPFSSSVYLAEHLPHAQLHVFPEAGHWAQIEQVDRFRAQLLLFLGER